MLTVVQPWVYCQREGFFFHFSCASVICTKNCVILAQTWLSVRVLWIWQHVLLSRQQEEEVLFSDASLAKSAWRLLSLLVSQQRCTYTPSLDSEAGWNVIATAERYLCLVRRAIQRSEKLLLKLVFTAFVKKCQSKDFALRQMLWDVL